MPSRAWHIGNEFAAEEAATEALNESFARNDEREQLAREAVCRLFGEWGIADDVEVADDADVYWHDGGYWVAAKVWVDFETVEDRLAEDGAS